MSYATADIVDEFGDRVSACLTQFRQFGGGSEFHGPIRTIKTFEDNALIRACLTSPVDGAVLVVDGNSSLRTALMGDNLASAAIANGWVGIVLLGAVRDSLQLCKLPFGVKALGTVPTKSAKNGIGSVDIPVHFGGVTFHPGHWLYSDDDGILLSKEFLPNPLKADFTLP